MTANLTFKRYKQLIRKSRQFECLDDNRDVSRTGIFVQKPCHPEELEGLDSSAEFIEVQFFSTTFQKITRIEGFTI